MTPPTHPIECVGLFDAEFYKFAIQLTGQLSSLIGGVMTPPYIGALINRTILP